MQTQGLGVLSRLPLVLKGGDGWVVPVAVLLGLAGDATVPSMCFLDTLGGLASEHKHAGWTCVMVPHTMCCIKLDTPEKNRICSEVHSPVPALWSASIKYQGAWRW